jgi:hypothetical protein
MTAVPRSLPLPPPDEALPAAATLLDAAAMTPHLAELFGVAVEAVRVRYLEYEPAVSLIAQYDARLASDPSVVVEAHARTIGSGWAMHAYPEDPALPLLAADNATLAAALGIETTGAPVDRLAWVPQRRAALRCGDVVVKLYANPAEAGTAVAALRALDGGVPTAALIAANFELGAVAQQALGGSALGRGDADGAVHGAAALLRGLHGLTIAGLDLLGPAAVLDAARHPARLAAFAVPGLAGRIDAAIDRLLATMPDLIDVVPVHGDFNLGQLLVDGDRTWVVDVDTLAHGSPAVDLAAYAANLHNGRACDSDEVSAVLARLVDAYGQAPPDLVWHLAAIMLRRVDRPLRRLKKSWPQRTEAVVTAIESLLR